VITYDGDAFTSFRDTRSLSLSEADRRSWHESADPNEAAVQMEAMPWVGGVASKVASRWMEAVPYHRLKDADVLVIGIGGGEDIRVAEQENAKHIDGVEINHSTIAAMTGPLAGFGGSPYNQPNVTVYAGDGRSFLMNTTKQWDVIHMTGIDSFLASSNGSFVSIENYLYTVEAMRSIYEHLRPGGMYTCVRWSDSQQPHESLRVFSNALAVMRQLGVAHPERQIVTATYAVAEAINIIKRGEFSADEVNEIREVAKRSGSQILYAGGQGGPQHPVFARLASDFVAGKADQFYATYQYDVTPVYDSRPYFYSYFRPSDLLDMVKSGKLSLGPSQHGYRPYLVLFAVLVQALVLVTLLIFGPLLWWRRQGLRVHGSPTFAVYFAALGAGYIMLELVLMQRFALVLGDPIYSIVVVLTAMLLFTGVGSFLSGRFATAPERGIRLGLTWICAAATFLLFAGPWLVSFALGKPLWMRVMISGTVAGALGTGLGMLFPLGVRVVSARSSAFLPWAWGINSGFSVIGSVATVIISMFLGFTHVLVIATSIYVIGITTMLWHLRAREVPQ
jgi:spermidine synthase